MRFGRRGPADRHRGGLVLRICFGGRPDEPPRLGADGGGEVFRVAKSGLEVWIEAVERGFQLLGGIAEICQRDCDIVVLRQLVAQVFNIFERF